MRKIFICALALMVAGTAYSREKKKDKDALEIELQSINEVLQGVRDSLESEIAARYSFKQHTVEQRETDKEEYERLREKQETVLNGLSKIKEEALVKEQNLSEAIKNAKDKQDEWVFVKNGFDEMMQKEADGLIEVFPTDLERRQGELEAVRRRYKEKYDPISGWNDYLRYRLTAMKSGRSVAIEQATLLPDDGAPRQFSVARFGNVFAYCMDTAKQVYMIRQTGRLGAARFAIEPVLSPELKGFLNDALPLWIQNNTVSGMVVSEVMQNEQAKELVAGQKKSPIEKYIESAKSGGWVMIPLFLLPLWALVLVFQKVLQFWLRRRKYTEQMQTGLELAKKDTAQALSFAKSRKGMMARILEACLDSPKGRESAEHAVRKAIMQETPVLNRNLNTLAVIAGAAPLLGLLGTISGMITLFAAVTYYGTGDPKFLAGGISEALVTAQTGLAVAIPTLLIHDFLRGRKEHLLSDIEVMASRVLDRLVPEE
jgi:biopolymer transport protein ExbB